MWEVPSSKERHDCKSSRYALGYDSLFELYLEQKLHGFGGVVSILGDPPAKQKTIDYYPVINTHITDNKAAHECPRYSEDGAKDVGQIQDRLSSILGPVKAMHWGPFLHNHSQPQE